MTAEKASPGSDPSVKPPTGGECDIVRLHITPFDAELFKVIIPTALQPSAHNVSYHTLETFPEKRFGFVELPRMDADKLKNKFHGSTLRGSKIRIEKARAEERVEPTGERTEKKRKKVMDDTEGTKKRKRDRNVVEGVTLKDRKVKRGWTESVEEKRAKRKKGSKDKEKKGEKRKRPISKYTDQEECLLKVKVPANAMANLSAVEGQRKRKKGKSCEITVHEFEKTTKFPSFLKNTVPETNRKSATDFVEGEGWMDEDGNLVEKVKPRPKAAASTRKESNNARTVVEESDDSTSSSGSETSSEEEDSDAGESKGGLANGGGPQGKSPLESGSKSESEPESESESGSESDSESEDSGDIGDDNTLAEPDQLTTQLSVLKADRSRPMSAGSSNSLSIKIPTPATPSASAKTVHPLEALYKRSKADGSEMDTAEAPGQKAAFSFFDAGSDVEEDEDDEADKAAVTAPMTPFSRQDFERRTVRSAAPTPDTAHPSRMKNFWPSQEEEEDGGNTANGDGDDGEEEEEEEDDNEEQAPGRSSQDKSDFQSWFWKNRSDLNKSWMTQRKAAAKEKRHRKNMNMRT
ncbi:hypothetical protein RJ55_00693 [Drechmeria coniospora]|nr:hypothetical protein RJ55_00693 [Drechmeria coniospora]